VQLCPAGDDSSDDSATACHAPPPRRPKLMATLPNTASILLRSILTPHTAGRGAGASRRVVRAAPLSGRISKESCLPRSQSSYTVVLRVVLRVMLHFRGTDRTTAPQEIYETRFTSISMMI